MRFEVGLTVCAADGVDLHVHRRPADGPTIIFCHGGTGCGRVWEELIPFVPDDWDVVAPDARGHGQSGRSPKYTWSDMASDIACTAEELGIHQPALVGHSMGASAVAACAILHRVNSCVALLDPPWWPGATVSDRREKATNWRRGIESSQRMTIDEHAVKSRQDWMSEAVVMRRVASERALDPAVLDPDFFEAIPDWREVGRQLPTPTVLVTADSGIVSPEQAAEVQRLNHRVEVANVTGAGHPLVDQKPSGLAQALVPFITEHART